MRQWWKLAAVVLVGVTAVCAWQFRVSWIVTADGQLEWTGAATPPTREVVWAGADQFESLLPKADPSAQMISPRLADNGSTLYFTLRRDGGQSDLYFAERDGLGWKPARPISAVNTEADELGPALSIDGRTLWFYSNRDGGQGGFDLYFSTRAGAEWSAPRNPGPAVNSIGDEYDPALSADGQTLFFASNRSDDVQQLIRDSQSQNAPWETTLRAKLSRAKFDLFRATRNKDSWQSSVALTSLNRPRSNEGAPFISRNGTWLYFASDRPSRSGEDSNLDIYRSRLVAGKPEAPENLGPTINSEHHETEPALSAEGFTLIFSSDRDGVDRLYRSRAQEIFHQSGWVIPAAPGWLSDVWLKALALTLVIAAIFGAIMHWRGLFGEQAYRARFLLSSLGLHLLIIAVLAWWTLPQVMEVIMAELEVEGPAMTPFEDTGDTDSPDSREAYEKVEDLPPVQDAAPVQPVERQAIAQQQPRPSEPMENPLPDLPQTVSHAVNPDRIAYVPAGQQPTTVERPELTRGMTPLQTELVTIEELPELAPAKEPASVQPAPQPTPLKVVRRDASAERPEIPRRQTPSEVMQITATVAELAEPKFAETPSVDNPTSQLQQNRQRPTPQLAQVEPQELPELANLEPALETPAQRPPAATELNRAPSSAPNLSSPTPMESVAKLPGLAGPEPTTASVSVAAAISEMAARPTTVSRPQFDRTVPEPAAVAGLPVTEETLSPEVVETATNGMLVAVDASVNRSTPLSPKAGSPQSSVVETLATSQPSAVSVAVVNQNVEITIESPIERIQRRGPASPLLADVADPSLAALEAVDVPEGQLAMVKRVDVDVRRQPDAIQPSAIPNPLKRSTEPVPELTVAAIDAPDRPAVPESEFVIDRPINAPVQRTRRDSSEVALAETIDDLELTDVPTRGTQDMKSATPSGVQVARTEVANVGTADQSIQLARSNLSARSLQVALVEPLDDLFITESPELQPQRNVPQTAELAEADFAPNLAVLAQATEQSSLSAERVDFDVERKQQPMKAAVDRTPMGEAINLQSNFHVEATLAESRSTVRNTELLVARLVNDQLTRTSDRQLELAAAASEEVALQKPLASSEARMDEDAAESATLNRAAEPAISAIPSPLSVSRSNVDVESFDIEVATIGQLSDLLPDPMTPSNGLTREALHPMTLAASQDTVELRSMFTLRKSENRRNLIDLLGGTPQSEQAVNRGLEWLANVQEDDGSWSLKRHQGQVKSRCAGTGFGLLPFLAAGHTHNQPGKYQQVVRKAIDWMLENQADDGNLMLTSDDQHHHMYSHGIGSIALSEAFGVSNDDALREPAQNALNFIIKAQHGSGGWRYRPGEKGDTSVVGWQMMALKSGEMAGLQVPTKTYAQVEKFINSVEEKKHAGRFGYMDRSPKLAMTAEGLLCLQFLGTNRNDARMRAGADWLLSELPEERQKRTSYYWYYATQVMYHMQGDYWEQWNARLRDMLVKTQKQSGSNQGSWDSRDEWDRKGGRVMATSMKLLMLEVYYRHLPLYDQLDD